MSDRHLPASTSTLRVDIRGAEILDEDESHETSDIYLPKHTELISHIALDIGGSLAKIVYFTRAANDSSLKKPPSPSTHGGPGTRRVASDDSATRSAPVSDATTRSEGSEEGCATSVSSGDDEGAKRASAGQPNGILNPTVVREEAYTAPRTSPDALARPALPGRPAASRPEPWARPLADRCDGPRLQEHLRGQAPPCTRRPSVSAIPGGRLNFAKFETDAIEAECIPFISNLIEVSARSNGVTIGTMKRAVKIILTGGGAYIYSELIERALGGEVEVMKEEEMECLIAGLNFITEIPNEVFWFSDELVQEIVNKNPGSGAGRTSESLLATSARTSAAIACASSSPVLAGGAADELPRPSPNPPQYSVLFDANPTPQFPCMLVNIGSGVSIIKVSSIGTFERISGTSLGGGTLWGLLSLLTSATSFDEMLDLSMKGDNSKVDMLVGDIYGQDYGKIGLKSSVIASSFGKVFKKRSATDRERDKEKGRKEAFRAEDISKSLLYAISNNIGQIAHLNAEKHGLDRIYFGGCFIRGHAATVSTLSYAIRFWSKGTKRAFFLRHEGYLGSIGAWLKNLDGEVGEAWQREGEQ